MKRKSNPTLSFRTAITLFALLMTMTVWAAQEPVRYIGMDGKTQTVTTYTEVTNGMSLRWNEGTYVVKTSTELSGSIRFDGEVVPYPLRWCYAYSKCR